ncbi:MAG: divergent polysaccharide deacetylase family protein [Pseudomonadota bacterium]
MAKGKAGDPSPFRSGLLHGFLSIATFGAIAGVMGAGIHFSGDPDEAGPQITVALFDGSNERPDRLKERFASPTLLSARVIPEPEPAREPSLGIADPGAKIESAAVPARESAGLQINGVRVLPGQSYSQVERAAGAAKSANLNPGASITQISITKAVDAAPAVQTHPNARPFSNPEGKPIIGIVIGGFGTSPTHSNIAIDDLPEGITLSFVPDANPNLLRKARQQGHEILAEIPMEAYSTGRTRPHQNTLTVSASEDQNAHRLRATLRRKPGIFGVISYDGAKFVGDTTAISAIAKDLSERNLGFIRHASLRQTIFETHADSLDMPYAAASVNIDARTDAKEIEKAFLTLETEALQNGYALGTGFVYPLTVDMVRDWATHLEKKGILLAPASAVAAARAKPIQTTQVSEDFTDRLTGTGEPAQQ